MNKIPLLLFIILSFFVQVQCDSASQSETDRGYIVKVGDKVADITFNLTDGESIRLSDLY